MLEKVKNLRSTLGSLIHETDGVRARAIPRSPFMFSPGDLVVFAYAHPDNHSTKVFLVTGTQRGPHGRFRSSKGNMLLSGFKVDFSATIFKTLAKVYYKNRTMAHYDRIIPLLFVAFGRSNFRTYNIAKIINPFEIDLQEEKFHGQ
jgi:hypothetical protein